MAQALGRDGDRERPALDGMLNILKPPGMTSHDVVSFIRRRLPKGTKVGHAGTLDPAAAGVLLVLAGRATRLSDYVMALDKEYRALVVFGTETDTGDGEGAGSSGGAGRAWGGGGGGGRGARAGRHGGAGAPAHPAPPPGPPAAGAARPPPPAGAGGGAGAAAGAGGGAARGAGAGRCGK